MSEVSEINNFFPLVDWTGTKVEKEREDSSGFLSVENRVFRALRAGGRVMHAYV